MTFRKILTSVFLLIAALSASTGAVSASDSDISIFIGAEMPGSIKHHNVRTGLDNSPVYGLRYGSDFTRQFGMEHSVAISPDYLFPSGSEAKETKGFIYNSNLRLNFPDIFLDMFPDDYPEIVPFLTVGAGITHQYGDRDLPVGTKFTFNGGGGIKSPNLAGPIGARADFRVYRAGLFTKQVNIFELSFGLMISLGN